MLGLKASATSEKSLQQDLGMAMSRASQSPASPVPFSTEALKGPLRKKLDYFKNKYIKKKKNQPTSKLWSYAVTIKNAVNILKT